MFVEGNVLVRISGERPENQARQYEVVFEEVAG